MRRVFPLLLFVLALLAACASSASNQTAGGSEQSGPVVTVFYSPA